MVSPPVLKAYVLKSFIVKKFPLFNDKNSLFAGNSIENLEGIGKGIYS